MMKHTRTLEQLKRALFTSINEVEDPELLEKVESLLNQNKIVGFEADGTPITAEALQKSVDQSVEDYKAGKYISQH